MRDNGPSELEHNGGSSQFARRIRMIDTALLLRFYKLTKLKSMYSGHIFNIGD